MKKFFTIIAIIILPGGLIVACFHLLQKFLKHVAEIFSSVDNDSSS